MVSKKEKIIRTALWCAAVLWMGMIFMFSAQGANESSETSRMTIEKLFEIMGITNTEEIFADEERYLMIDFIVRKSAHFCIFGVLGVLLASAVSRYADPGRFRCLLTAFLIGVLYALTDELHQYFVPGRACQLRDVCIDSVGVLCGCTAVYLVMKLMLRKKVKK